MNPFKRQLHCLVKLEPEGYWAAYCLDFTLYAVGGTRAEAEEKLALVITEYVRDAVVGPDAEFGDQLLARRAPLADWVLFYGLLLWQKVSRFRDNLNRAAFQPVIPLVPPCTHA